MNNEMEVKLIALQQFTFDPRVKSCDEHTLMLGK